MKKFLFFLISLGFSLSVLFLVSETLMAFEWVDRGITVKSEETSLEGARAFLEDATGRSFVVLAKKELLTDPVKESILNTFNQIGETYNLAVANVEFKISEKEFKTTLTLQDNEQVVVLSHYSLTPPSSLIPVSSIVLNEFNAWNEFKLKTLQFRYDRNKFEIIAAPVTENPFVEIRVNKNQPPKLLVSNLAVLFNAYSSWKNIAFKEIIFKVGAAAINTSLVSTEGDRTIEFMISGTKPSEKDVNRVSEFYNAIADWKQISYSKILLTANGKVINAVVAPSKVTYKDKDFSKNIPSGMNFRYDNKLQFDFRVTSKDYFVRLKNNYTNENKLLWQLNEAITDPIRYIQVYDPDFFYRQLQSVQNRQVEVFDNLNSEFKKKYEELQMKHEALLASYENLKKAHEAFIYGYMTLENAGFMSTEPVDKLAIARVVELKAENSDLTVSQIEEELEKEKLEVPKKIINLVFNLYFNDFKN